MLTFLRSSSPVLVMISSMSVPICNHLYTKPVIFNLFCCSGMLHKCQKPSRNPVAWNDPWVQWRRQSGIFRMSGDRCPQRSWETKNLWQSGENPETLTIKQQAKTRLILPFIFPVTKNTLRGGRQRPKNYHWIFYLYFFTPRDSSGGLDPPSQLCCWAKLFLHFSNRVFQEMKGF